MPIAIRYPRGRGTILDWEQPFETIKIGTSLQLKKGGALAVLTIGTMATNATEAIVKVENSSAENIAHYDFRFLKPLDEVLLHEIFSKHKNIITVEDGVKKGGLGSAIVEFAAENNYKNNINILGIPDEFPEHGTVEELQEIAGISAKKIRNAIENFLLN